MKVRFCLSHGEIQNQKLTFFNMKFSVIKKPPFKHPALFYMMYNDKLHYMCVMERNSRYLYYMIIKQHRVIKGLFYLNFCNFTDGNADLVLADLPHMEQVTHTPRNSILTYQYTFHSDQYENSSLIFVTLCEMKCKINGFVLFV